MGHTQPALSRASMHVPIKQNTEIGTEDVNNPTAETTSITTTARGNVTNQERQEYILTGHKAELFNKDQPSMGNIITTTARGN